jgi:hypothetical protein
VVLVVVDMAADLASPWAADWSSPATAWHSVAAAQKKNDDIAREVLALPLAEFRALGYRPPPLPTNAPIPGKDIDISTLEITVRDGAKVSLRLFQPRMAEAGKLLFFNAHGGGTVLFPLITRRPAFGL